MNIHGRMRELMDLAVIYAEDGAFMTAANKLRQLADELEIHHCTTMLDAASRTVHRNKLVKRLADRRDRRTTR